MGALALAAVLASCTAAPYVEPEVPRPGLMRKADGTIHKSRQHEIQPVPVTVPVAREYARLLQDAYRRAAGQQSALRVALDTTLIGAAATAIAIAATGGSAETAGLIGIGGGALGVAGSRWLNATHRRIYFQGALALECVITAGIKDLRPQAKSVELKLDILNLEAWAGRVEVAAREFGATPPQNAADSLAIDAAAQQIADAQREVARLRIVAAAAREFLDQADPLGQLLLSKTEEIRIRVDAEVAKAEPDLLGYNEALKGLLQTAPSGTGSKADTAGGKKAPKVQDSAPFRGESPAVTKARQKLEETLDEAQAAERSLLDNMGTFQPTTIPANLFSDCALADKIGAAPLRLASVEKSVTASAESQLQVSILGGRQPYTVKQDLLPKDVTAKIVPQTADMATLDIKVAKDALKAGSAPVVVIVQDSSSDTRNLVIRVAAAKAPKPSGGGSGGGGGGGGAPVVSDADADKIQKFILNAMPIPGVNVAKPLGDTGQDGKWGKSTKAASIAYLSQAATFSQLQADATHSAELTGKTTAYLGTVDDAKVATIMIRAIDQGY
ncbi:MAG: hypothetical protein RIM84_15725 [Alphaproteobacteria bacterium]